MVATVSSTIRSADLSGPTVRAARQCNSMAKNGACWRTSALRGTIDRFRVVPAHVASVGVPERTLTDGLVAEQVPIARSDDETRFSG